MKNLKKLLALLLALAMVFALAACGGGSDSEGGTSTGGDSSTQGDDSQQSGTETPTEKQDVSLVLWGAEEDQTLLSELVEGFKEEYADYANFNITIGVESESTAKDTILTDISAAADVFAFASDQLPDLVKAGALQSLDDDTINTVLETYAGKSIDDVKSANSAGSVDTASYQDTLYAFPMSSDNGYFLYYDSSVLSEEDVASWDSLLAAASAAGKQVAMTLASGWYNAGFFYGAGFTTVLNDDGTTTIDWNGTSASGISGVDVVKGMISIASNSAFMACADGGVSDQIASGNLCAAVSGTWDATAAQTAFGDGYAATKLPTFTCAGQQIQMGSVVGSKLIGVNALSENTGWAVLLAEYLTNEEAQATRFAERQIGPSNLNVTASDAVSENVAISALAAQSAYGVNQTVGGKFWDPAATFGEMIAQGQLSADDDAAIQAALDELVTGVGAAVE